MTRGWGSEVGSRSLGSFATTPDPRRPTPHTRYNPAPMPDETESGASLLARREYARAVPLLKRDLDKYQNNPRIRLQYADALAGAGEADEAIAQYEHTAKYYEDNGLTVQAIAVAKKAEKRRGAPKPQEETAGKSDPLFTRPVPKSPLFEVLSEDERNALVREMELES